MTAYHRFLGPLATIAAVTLTACADGTPVGPARALAPRGAQATLATVADFNTAIAELRRATAKYHDVSAALADGFVPVVAGCEEREGEARVAIPYASIARILDGVLDPSLPDALLYEPAKDGKHKLVGVEMVIPYPLWTAAQPPRFLGVPLQREDELGVFGLHVWVWRHNPNGMFAVDNPNVSCDLAS